MFGFLERFRPIAQTVTNWWIALVSLWKTASPPVRAFAKFLIAIRPFLALMVALRQCRLSENAERAQVTVQMVGIPHLKAGEPLSFRVGLYNIGILPAYHARSQVWCFFRDDPDHVTEEMLRNLEPTHPNTITEVTLYKNTLTSGLDCVMEAAPNDAQVAALKDGKALRVFTWGRSQYKTLEQDKWTNFCWGVWRANSSRQQGKRLPFPQ